MPAAANPKTSITPVQDTKRHRGRRGTTRSLLLTTGLGTVDRHGCRTRSREVRCCRTIFGTPGSDIGRPRCLSAGDSRDQNVSLRRLERVAFGPLIRATSARDGRDSHSRRPRRSYSSEYLNVRCSSMVTWTLPNDSPRVARLRSFCERSSSNVRVPGRRPRDRGIIHRACTRN